MVDYLRGLTLIGKALVMHGFTCKCQLVKSENELLENFLRLENVWIFSP